MKLYKIKGYPLAVVCKAPELAAAKATNAMRDLKISFTTKDIEEIPLTYDGVYVFDDELKEIIIRRQVSAYSQQEARERPKEPSGCNVYRLPVRGKSE